VRFFACRVAHEWVIPPAIALRFKIFRATMRRFPNRALENWKLTIPSAILLPP
jgi:hypothetical protein